MTEMFYHLIFGQILNRDRCLILIVSTVAFKMSFFKVCWVIVAFRSSDPSGLLQGY